MLSTLSPHRDFFVQELSRSYLLTEPATQSETCTPLRVEIDQVAQPLAGIRVTQYPQGEGWVADGKFYLRTGQACVEVQLQPRLEVTLTLQAEPDEQARIAFGYALQAVMRYSGRYTAHAAAVVEPETQTGVLLLGASGSGKTTTALQLVRQGWGYLSDDLLLLGATEAGIAAWGLRRAFAATEQTLASCDYTGAQRPAGHRMGAEIPKLAFDPQALFPAQYIKQCVPQHLVYVEVADRDKSELQPLAQRAALQQLLPQSQWACFDPDTTNQHLNLLLTLSEQAQGWTLKAGRDWLTNPAQAARRLAAALAAEKNPERV